MRTWERSPQLFADTLATSLAGQALFDYAPLAERARRVLSKLRQVPRLMQSARDNIKDPPGIYVKVGLESLRGTLRFIHDDLPRAFADLGDLHLLGDLADAATEASSSIGGYIEYLETDLAPRSKGSFRLGREKFEQKFQLDEGLTIGAARLLEIAMRELRATQDEFRRVASRLNGGDPLAAWQKAKADHPPAGQLVTVAQQQLEELDRVHPRRAHHLGARGRAGRGRARRRASTAGPRRACGRPGRSSRKPVRAFYYITDVDPAWPPERQDEHLRDFNYGALWAISIHEVFPGHFLHYQHLRQVESTLRKSILFSSSAFVEGWAHYCEQMMVDEGFRKSDPGVRLGQLAEALIRLCRCIVGIRLHCEDMSVEQARAILPRGGVSRRAERAARGRARHLRSLVHPLLRRQADAAEAARGLQGAARARSSRCAGSTTRCSATARVPIWLHRALMLGEQNGELIE